MTLSPSDVSVVVPTRGDRPQLLLRALCSILSNDHQPREIVVVDQGTSASLARAMEDIAEQAGLTPRVLLVRTPAAGVAHARNLGVRATTAPIIAFLDDDCNASPHWLANLVSVFSGDPTVGIAFGSVLPVAHDTSETFVFSYIPPRRRRLVGRRAKLWDAGIGGNMAVRRSTYLQAGGFDEMLGYGGYFPSVEDQDLTYRVLRAGFALAHVPEATVVHHGMRDIRASRALIRGTYVAIGAAYSKYARCGDWTAALLLLNELRLAIWNVLRNASNRRRPLGIGRLASLVVGVYRSFELDVDPVSGLYVKPMRWSPARSDVV